MSSDGQAIYYDGHKAGYLDAIRMFWDETSGASTDELRALGASLRAAYPRVREAAQARDAASESDDDEPRMTTTSEPTPPADEMDWITR